MAIAQEELYSNKIFLNAALPLVKVLATEVPYLSKKFDHAHAVIQVSCLNPEVPEGKVGMHLASEEGKVGTYLVVPRLLRFVGNGMIDIIIVLRGVCNVVVAAHGIFLVGVEVGL